MRNPFGSKKKRFVATSISRVIEDNQIPDLAIRSSIRATLDGSHFGATLLDEMINSTTQGITRAYRYARDGDYYYGLPGADVLDAADGRDEVQAVIEAQVGAPVSLDYFYFAPLNNLHAGWQWLVDSYGYAEYTNEVETLTAQWGQKVYVHNLVGTINSAVIASDDPDKTTYFPTPDDGTMEVWGRHPQDRYTPFRDANAAKVPVWQLSETATDGVRAHLIGADGTTDTLFLDLSGYDEDLIYFQARYRYGPDNKSIGYFTYEHGSGLYPTLDALHAGTTLTQSFMPLVLFRHDAQNRTATTYHDTAAYQTSVKLMDMMGLDYQEIGDAVHDNPDADKIEQAAMMFAVPATSTDPIDVEYLFRFFDWLHEQFPTTRYVDRTALTSYRPSKAIRIRDADFDCTLSYAGLSKHRKHGQACPVGEYVADTVTHTNTIEVELCDYDDESGTTSCSNSTQYVTSYIRRYRHQLTANQYVQVEVANLQMRYDIYDVDVLFPKVVTVSLQEDPDKLLVPLSYDLAQAMAFRQRESLYWRSLHFVVNSMQTVTVEWYETGLFRDLMIAVAVVLTIKSFGAGSAFYAAIAAGAYGVATLIILQHIVLSLALQYAVELAIEELGVEYAVVLAAIAAGAGLLNTDTTWGTRLLQASTSLSQGANTAIGKQLAQYRSESQDFVLMADAKMAELEELEQALATSPDLDPFAFIGQVPVINPGEAPNTLYERTVHTGNIGTLAYDYIESFVDLRLQLPTLQDTARDIFYG